MQADSTWHPGSNIGTLFGITRTPEMQSKTFLQHSYSLYNIHYFCCNKHKIKTYKTQTLTLLKMIIIGTSTVFPLLNDRKFVLPVFPLIDYCLLLIHLAVQLPTAFLRHCVLYMRIASTEFYAQRIYVYFTFRHIF